MKLKGDGHLVRIFIGERDQWQGKPLYESIVTRAREAGLAGATVFRGFMGFGANSRIHVAKVLRMSEDLPVVVEIADRTERIEGFLPLLDEMVTDGLVTIERIQVIAYRGK